MSQRSSPLPANHPVKQLVGLARQIALPHEYEPERFPSFPALERTAKLSFNQPSNFDVPANTTRKLALFRQAAYPLWVERSLTGTDGYVVSWATAVTPAVSSSANEAITAIFMPQLFNWQNTNRTPAEGDQPMGIAGLPTTPNVFKYPILAYDYATGPQPFVYIPAGAGVQVVLRTIDAEPNWQGTVMFEQWDRPGEIHTVAVGIDVVEGKTGAATGPTDLARLSGGWYRPAVAMINQAIGAFTARYMIDVAVGIGTITYANSTTTPGVLTFGTATNALFVPVAPPAEFVNSMMPWQATRVTAAAVLATNVTTVLNKGGTVLAGRVTPEVSSPWEVTSTTINLLHPAEKAFLPFETGLYTYCPPSTDLAHFWDYTLGNTTSSRDVSYAKIPVHRLDNDSMVNYAFFSSPANIESVALNMDWHIEFRTSSALFDVGMSTMTLETLHQAQIVLASVGFFFENFDHKAILNAVISAAKKYGPAVANVFHPLAGQFADLILSKIPEPGMASTSISVKPPQPALEKARKKKKNKKPKPPQPQQPGKAKMQSGLDMYLASKKKSGTR